MTEKKCDHFGFIFTIVLLSIILLAFIVIGSFIFNGLQSELYCGDEDLNHEYVYDENAGFATYPLIGHRCCEKVEWKEMDDTGKWHEYKRYDCKFVKDEK